ncbi:hypothetical protein ON010_g16490 [Phytophthora cinnamomi]|nr:hypothetical protein ON010_g16490 [Phytophthora cinnamomi]
MELPHNSVLHSQLQDGPDEPDRSTWRHNAPAPVHQNVAATDDILEQVSAGLISNFTHVDIPTGVQLALDKSRVIVYRLSSILSDFDPAFWVNACSPMVVGGFNAIASHNSLQAISIKARISPSSMDQVASISREGLEVYVQYQQERLRAVTNQLQPPEAPEIDDRVRKLYFDYVMKTFIEVVLNWDIERGCSYDGPGLSGRTRGYYAATESQNSTGSLHSHMLIWIEGMPSAVEEYYSMCPSERFRSATAKYVGAIATSSVPLDMKECPVYKAGTINWRRVRFNRGQTPTWHHRHTRATGATRPRTTCNNDIKVLGAGEGPEKSYYTIKYSTKPQNDIDKSWVIHLHAFAKASRSTIEDSSDIAAIGRRRIQSMCCTLSNPHDISTPMACLYIDRGPAMYSSHEFVKLPITSVFCALFEQEKNIPVVLESDTNMRQFKPSGIRLDYTYRPEGLEDVGLMTFATQWIKKSKKGQKFSEQHPLVESHSMFKLSEQRIATVLHNASPRYPPTGSAGSGAASLPANHHSTFSSVPKCW